MKINRDYLLLALIFFFVLGFRLFFLLRTTNFSDSTSYFNLRQIEHIKQTGFPIYQDDLSYSGRFFVFLPFFHYVLAIFSIILPFWLVGKLIPAIFASSLVLITYFISFEITNNAESSLFTSLIAGFIPVFIDRTTNAVSVYTLAIPLTLTVLYFLMKVINNTKYVPFFLISISLLAITHQSVFMLIISLLFYFVLIRLEKLKQSKAEFELILFSSFFITWLSFVLFKKAFLLYGPALIWQNLPPTIMAQYFKDFNILEAIYKIGIIPFVFGFYIIYKTVFIEKNRKIYLLISFALTVLILVWLRLVPLELGLIYLSVFLTLLFSPFYKILIEYIKKTKFSKNKNLFVIIFLFIFVLTSFIPSIGYANSAILRSVDGKEIEALNWLREKAPNSSVVLATLDEGHLITSIAQRKNVFDNNFLMQPQADQRLNDVKIIYTTKFETEAIRLLNKYNVDYIIFSENAKKDYQITQLDYVADEKCFKLVYDNSIKIYNSLCKIEEEK